MAVPWKPFHRKILKTTHLPLPYKFSTFYCRFIDDMLFL